MVGSLLVVCKIQAWLPITQTFCGASRHVESRTNLVTGDLAQLLRLFDHENLAESRVKHGKVYRSLNG